MVADYDRAALERRVLAVEQRTEGLEVLAGDLLARLGEVVDELARRGFIGPETGRSGR